MAGLLLVVAGTARAVNETRVFKMGLLTPWHLGYDFSGYTCASAVTIAMERVHADPELNANGRIKLRYTRHSHQPVSFLGILAATLWWFTAAPKPLKIQVFWGHPAPRGRTAPIF